MDHQDSHGGGGSITNGDTQWMTAGAGLLHIETPPEWLVAKGGLFHGVQLWVNLPREQKWAAPRYQDLRSSQLGLVTTSDAGALVRIIAGSVDGLAGPGSTHTPMAMVHGSLEPGARLDLPWEVDFNALVYVLAGEGSVGVEQRPLRAGQLAVLGRGDFVSVTAAGRQDSRTPTMEVLVLGGRPIREPVAWGGPFVMNSKAEVLQAFEDFQTGRMGRVPAVHGLTDEVVER
jgi:quercetin 2,3-dioxygenase